MVIIYYYEINDALSIFFFFDVHGNQAYCWLINKVISYCCLYLLNLIINFPLGDAVY
jgi:hypothetical protein